MASELTPEAIAELRRLLVKSTPGPFGIVATCQASRGGRPDPSSDQYSLRTMIPTAISTSAGDLTSLPLDIGSGLGEADASFFAAVRNSADALLDAAERCAKAEKRHCEVVDWYSTRWERLRAEVLPAGSEAEKKACDIMANGHLLMDHAPASPLALAVARAEKAEERCAAAEAALKHKETGYEILAGTYKALLEQLVGLKAQAKAAGELLRAAKDMAKSCSHCMECGDPVIQEAAERAIEAAERAGVKP